MKKPVVLLVMLNLFQHSSFSQDQHLVDSLETQLKNYKIADVELGNAVADMHDTLIVNILFELSKIYWGNNPEKAMDYEKQSLSLSERIGFKKGIGNAYHSMGVVNYFRADYLQAMEFYKQSLKIRLEINDKRGIAGSYGNIGLIYDYQGNYPEALKNHFASLKANEEIGNKKGIVASYGNIGLNYDNQGNYSEALKNYSVALKTAEDIGDKYNIANTYNNIGVIYKKQGNYSEALKNHFACLKIMEELKVKMGIASSYNNIGTIYKEQENYTESLRHQLAALKIREEIGDKNGIAMSYGNIGNIYTRQKKYDDASLNLNKSLALSKEIGSLDGIKESYGSLAELDSARGDFKQAFEDQKLYMITRDNLVNEESTKKIAQIEMQHKFDKKEQEVTLLKSQQEIDRINASRRLGMNFGLGGALLGVMSVAFAFYKQNKKTKMINANLEVAYRKLEDTQAQLIKSEKMAAFGVMASRVSHEIQNPLNFVNNFSELSQEIVADVIKSTSEEDKKQLADMLIANLQKINEHGKRAAGIVKQLQEHTLKGTAQEFFEEKNT